MRLKVAAVLILAVLESNERKVLEAAVCAQQPPPPHVGTYQAGCWRNPHPSGGARPSGRRAGACIQRETCWHGCTSTESLQERNGAATALMCCQSWGRPWHSLQGSEDGGAPDNTARMWLKQFIIFYTITLARKKINQKGHLDPRPGKSLRKQGFKDTSRIHGL